MRAAPGPTFRQQWRDDRRSGQAEQPSGLYLLGQKLRRSNGTQFLRIVVGGSQLGDMMSVTRCSTIMTSGAPVRVSISTPSTEATLPPVGAVCILGRGIERVSTSRGPVWRPTRYIEVPSANGEHGGCRLPADPNDDVSLIAGSNANVIASCELWARLALAGKPFRLLILGAGRPAYLAAESDPALTEGRILVAHLLRRAHPPLANVEIITLERNRNTRDDIEETIALAGAKLIDTVGIITVQVHLPRSIEFARRSRWRGRPVHLIFTSAEALLAHRYSKHRGVMSVLTQVESMAAYHRTLTREEHGLLALVAGRYDSRDEHGHNGSP